MAKHDEHDDRNKESNYSGEFGERNRNTPGRTPGELGLDPEEMRGHDIVGETPERVGDPVPETSLSGDRKNPDLTPDAGGPGEYKGTSRFDPDRGSD
jgi:hypothetical protein